MKGNSKVADFSVLFPLQGMVEQVADFDYSTGFINAVIINGLEVVEQIIVDEINTQVFKLPCKYRLDFLLLFQIEGREFCCDDETCSAKRFLRNSDRIFEKK